MLSTIGAIAAGGAIGAVMRHFVNVASFKLFGDGFPWATLGVNVIGSFAMGILIGVFAHYWQPSPEVKALLVTGFLGAFTTFSTFSLDAVALFERHSYAPLVAYILASVALSITALFAALALIRYIAA